MVGLDEEEGGGSVMDHYLDGVVDEPDLVLQLLRVLAQVQDGPVVVLTLQLVGEVLAHPRHHQELFPYLEPVDRLLVLQQEYLRQLLSHLQLVQSHLGQVGQRVGVPPDVVHPLVHHVEVDNVLFREDHQEVLTNHEFDCLVLENLDQLEVLCLPLEDHHLLLLPDD